MPTRGGIYYESSGKGPLVVLAHGSWSDQKTWRQLVAQLAASYRVVTYDRRGYGQSEGGPPKLHAEEAQDLTALLGALESGPAHLVGNSIGGTIALRVGLSRPELVRSLALHEPPLMGLLRLAPDGREVFREQKTVMTDVIARLAAGDNEGGARIFIDNVAFYPGMWETLPVNVRQTFTRYGPNFLAEANDPSRLEADPAVLKTLRPPLLLTWGDKSPPWLLRVEELLHESVPGSSRRQIHGAGHVPQVTHPREYAQALNAFWLSLR